MAQKKLTWVFPVNSRRITQTSHPGHLAVDIGVPVGTKVSAPMNGRVIYAGYNNQGYGNLVEIQTSDGKKILLAHLSQINVKVGQSVGEGQQVGKSGNTGNSTGPHLHYEIRGVTDPLSLSYGGVPASTTGAPPPPTQTTPKGQPVRVKRDTSGNVVVDPNLQSPTGKLMTEGVLSPLMDWVNGLNWGNVIAALVGIILIAIGVTGVVLGESAKAVLSPAVESITEAVKQ